MAHPVCSRLGDHIEAAAREAGIEAVRGGTYLVMEGPQFSSLAESELYRSWDCDVIGMTNMPEAKLAREAELCYATVAMVTDYDCWHPDHDDVTVEADHQGAAGQCRQGPHPGEAGGAAAAARSRPRPAAAAARALEHALITAPEARDPGMVQAPRRGRRPRAESQK